MKTIPLSRQVTSLLLGATLFVLAGCGGSESGGGAAVNSAEASQLEAKVAQGDSAAALKLGELYAAKAGDREAQIEAAKWFHIASRLGNTSAGLALNAVTAQMTLEDQSEVDRRVAAFPLPAK